MLLLLRYMRNCILWIPERRPICRGSKSRPISISLAKWVAVAVIWAAGFAASAQKNGGGSVDGKLLDSLANEAVAGASVSAIRIADSSVVNFTVTNSKGEFELQGLPIGMYQLVITGQSYPAIRKPFVLTAHMPQFRFGIIHMERKDVLLKEVVVEAPPVVVKGDTVEYRASAFKTAPNATAEALLKKLPGVEVDRDGSVRTQGETVQKIYVDGKEFFGNDPTIATRNITADMIESVQVYTDKSDAAKFSHIDDGSRIKTINIKLKKDRQQGAFGRAVAGYGTANRTENAGSYHRFAGSRRLSVVGGYNNINRTASNANDLSGSSPSGYMPNGAAGISTSGAAGVNYVDNIGGKLKISGSYFYTHITNRSERTSITQAFLPNDSGTMRTGNSAATNATGSHRFNLRLEYNLDSNNSLIVTSALNAQASENNATDSATLYGVKATQHSLYNYSTAYNHTNNKGLNRSEALYYQRRFAKWGRTLSVGYTHMANGMDGHILNRSALWFYAGSSAATSQKRDVQSLAASRSSSNGVTLSYTEPVGKKSVVELNYSYNTSRTSLNRQAFNYNPVTNAYDSLNPQLTNDFENTFGAGQYGARFKIQTDQYGFQVGGSVQTSQWTNKTSEGKEGAAGKDSVSLLQQRAVNFFPAISYSYNFSPSKSFRVNYYGRTRQPGARQLQQVPDVSNPVQVYMGNPYLHQEFTSDVNIGYNAFNPVSFRYVTLNVNLSTTANKIVNSIDTVGARLLRMVQDKSVQLIQPVNSNGAFSSAASLTVGSPIRHRKGSYYSLTHSVFYNREVNVVYGVNNNTGQLTVSQGANLNISVGEKLDAGLRADVSYNSVRYGVQASRNTHYLSQNYTADLQYSWSDDLILYSGFTYRDNGDLVPGVSAAFALWNASAAYQFLKQKKGELRLSASDILNEAKSITRVIGENYIADNRTNVLQRYFMLTFTYKFNGAMRSAAKTGAKAK